MKDLSKHFLENNPLVQKKIKVIQEWVKNHGKIWARRALYELVSKQLVRDTSNSSYQQTCKLFQNLREYGIIPYDWFKDKRTTVQNIGIEDYGDFENQFNSLCKYYTRSSKALQKNYVEIWTEKELSEDTIALIDQYDIGLIMGEGFIGDIPFHDTTQRIQQIENDYNLPIRIIYISDYDCKGEHTFNLCKQTLEPLGDVTVTKVFLTKTQVRNYNLIPNIGYRERMLKPSKLKTHLSKQYVKEFFNGNKDLERDGMVQYEFDQIDIELLKKSLADTISSFIDVNVIANREKACRKEVAGWLSKHYTK